MNDLLDISPNPPLPKPLRVGIFCDRLSGKLGLFPTFHVTGLIPGNGSVCDQCVMMRVECHMG